MSKQVFNLTRVMKTELNPNSFAHTGQFTTPFLVGFIFLMIGQSIFASGSDYQEYDPSDKILISKKGYSLPSGNIVTNSNNSGQGSLREAINCAISGSTITFHSSTDNVPIMLNSSELFIDKDLTIIGNGIGVTIIDGALNASSRLMYVSGSTLHLEGISFVNGGGPSLLDAGGIFLDNDHDTTIERCHFENNESLYGGALNIIRGSATIRNSLFINNKVVNGPGAVAIIDEQLDENSVSFQQCLFVNQITNSQLISYGTSVRLEMIHSTFVQDGEDVPCIGGDGHVIIKNTIFKGSSPAFNNYSLNIAETSNNLVSVYGQMSSVNNLQGDAIFIDEKNEDYRLSVFSPGIDQGVQLANSPSMDFEGDYRLIGESIDIGYDEYSGSNLVIPYCKTYHGDTNTGKNFYEDYSCVDNMSGNEIIHQIETYGEGDLVATLSNANTLMNAIILDQAGEPMSCVGYGSSTITYTEAPEGIYYIVVDGKSGISGTYDLTVAANFSNVVTNTDDSGCGSLRDVIENAEPGSLIRFDPITADSPIYLTSGEIVIDKDLTIEGLGMYNTIIDGSMDNMNRLFTLSSGHLQLKFMTVQNGGGPDYNDSGAAIYTSGTLDLLAVKFYKNQNKDIGTAITQVKGITNIQYCQFKENICSEPNFSSTVIWVQGENSKTNISQNLFVNNEMPNGNVFLLIDCKGGQFKQNTFADNTAWGLIFAQNTEQPLDYFNNINASTGYTLAAAGSSFITGNNLSVESDVNLPADVGNIFGDPKFLDPSLGNYQLDFGSPCFNAGNKDYLPNDIFDVDGDLDFTEPILYDISGLHPRVISGTLDIGANERIPDACEDVYPISCGEAFTTDITGYIVYFNCDEVWTSKIHVFTPEFDGLASFSLANFNGYKEMYFYEELCDEECIPLSFGSETLDYPVISGKTYYLEVYDYSFIGGTYDLGVSCIANCLSSDVDEDGIDDDLELVSPDNDIINDFEIHSTNTNIIASNQIGTSANVIYTAGNTEGRSVTLGHGFTVEAGSRFTANLDGCYEPIINVNRNMDTSLSSKTEIKHKNNQAYSVQK